MGPLLDWKFGKSARVARSPLAAEAMAADEAVDCAVFLNLFFTEVLTGTPAHCAEPLFQYLRTTDAKSLYDNLVSESPNLADKRSLVNVRAAQEVLAPNQLHWAPTQLMRADGLTKMSAALLAESHKWLKKLLIVLREVVVRAVDAEEVVRVDQHYADDLARRRALDEDHLVEAVLDVVKSS